MYSITFQQYNSSYTVQTQSVCPHMCQNVHQSILIIFPWPQSYDDGDFMKATDPQNNTDEYLLWSLELWEGNLTPILR